MKYKVLFSICFLIPYIMFAQNAITYSYDSAGNRIERTPVVNNLAFLSQEPGNGMVEMGIIPTFVANDKTNTVQWDKYGQLTIVPSSLFNGWPFLVAISCNGFAIKSEESYEEIKDDKSKTKQE